MSTLTDDIKQAISYVEPALVALETIQKITGTGGIPAAEALAAIDGIVTAFTNGVAADASPAAILAEMATFDKSIATNDAGADAALAAKFPVTGAAT